MNIVLLGAPGSGKGTQAEKLIAKCGLCHISSGDLLRQAVKDGTELGKEAKGYMDAGDLVPDELIIGMMKERMQQPDTEAGVMFDGFPRSTPQAEALDAMLTEVGRPVDAALLIDVPFDTVITRLTSRRQCRDCGKIGNKADAACPACGVEMYQRDDDNEETVKNRLDVYQNQTAPVIDYYEAQGKLVSVDGDKAPDEVFAEVEEKLGL